MSLRSNVERKVIMLPAEAFSFTCEEIRLLKWSVFFLKCLIEFFF